MTRLKPTRATAATAGHLPGYGMTIQIRDPRTDHRLELAVRQLYAGCRRTLEHPADPAEWEVIDGYDIDADRDLTAEQLNQIADECFDQIAELAEETA